MNRYEAMEFDTFMGYIKESSVNKRIHQIYNMFEDLQKENTRLRKQLSSNHHIECSCSFCKPVGENNGKI